MTGNPLPYVVAVSGASGAPYARRLLQWFHDQKISSHLLITSAGRKVIEEETGVYLGETQEEMEKGLSEFIGKDYRRHASLHDLNNWSSPLASGSFKSNAMIVIPCSVHTLSAIACGSGSNLLERRADIMLKEKRKLILVFRETPLNSIHLEHLLKLSRMNAHILPAMPAFYHHPKTIENMIDFVVGRVLDALDLPNELFKRWGT